METLATQDILSKGDLLNWYRIESVLGRGGFGITYLATDTNLQKTVAIKEYLPDQIASRDPNNSLRPSSPELDETFRWGLDRFIVEARTLAKFSHPNIVRVLSVFEANDTAYMVMEYEGGIDFKSYLKQNSINSEENLKTLFHALLDGLKLVHENGFIHRDIKPANIIIRENGSPVLIDFGSARKSYDHQTRTLTSLVSIGYAPLEQYSSAADNKQGPWTDIYASGAVLYYAITGNPPVDATQRGSSVLNNSPDPLIPITQLAPAGYSREFLNAIDWALNFAINDRPQSVLEWSSKLFQPATDENPEDKTRIDDRTRLMPPGLRTPKNVSSEFTPGVQTDNGWQSPKTTTSPISIATTEEWEIDNIRSQAPGKSHYATPKKTASTFKASPLLLVLTVFILVGATALYYFSQLSPDDTLGSAKTTSTAATAPLNQPDASPSTSPNASKKSESLHLVATAFEKADMSAVKTLVDLSPRYEQVLASLFRQFSSIELAAIDSTSTDTVLTIVRMKRATGTYAVPAASFRHLVLTPPDPQRPEYKWKL